MFFQTSKLSPIEKNANVLKLKFAYGKLAIIAFRYKFASQVKAFLI